MENNIHYNLQSIDDGVYIDNSRPTEMTDGFSAETLGFQYKLTTRLNLQDNTIIISPQVRYAFQGKVLMETSVSYRFRVSDLHVVAEIDKEENKVRLDTIFMSTLIGIAFSGLRGIVHERAKGGILAAYPVPVIIMDDLLKNNAIQVV